MCTRWRTLEVFSSPMHSTLFYFVILWVWNVFTFTAITEEHANITILFSIRNAIFVSCKLYRTLRVVLSLHLVYCWVSHFHCPEHICSTIGCRMIVWSYIRSLCSVMFHEYITVTSFHLYRSWRKKTLALETAWAPSDASLLWETCITTAINDLKIGLSKPITSWHTLFCPCFSMSQRLLAFYEAMNTVV